MKDLYYMKEAIKEARLAYDQDEVPIGCVIVLDGKIIARGHNTVEQDKLAISHAEINAIKAVSEFLGDWRLDKTTMYITKEPCAMCAGAIFKSRIKRLVIGTRDLKMGCAGSLYNLVDDDNFNHKVEITYDVMADESVQLLQEFFKEKRRGAEQDE